LWMMQHYSVCNCVSSYDLLDPSNCYSKKVLLRQVKTSNLNFSDDVTKIYYAQDGVLIV
jgi:hypothetical protein